MKKKLVFEALTKYITGFFTIALLLFLSAGTIRFVEGWLFLGVLFVPMLIMGIFFLIKNPALLQKRMESKEKEQTQKAVIFLSFLMFTGGFLLAGFDYRFSLFKVIPFSVSIVFSVIFLLFYLLYFEVMRENAYLARTVKVEKINRSLIRGSMALSVTPCIP